MVAGRGPAAYFLVPAPRDARCLGAQTRAGRRRLSKAFDGLRKRLVLVPGRPTLGGSDPGAGGAVEGVGESCDVGDQRSFTAVLDKSTSGIDFWSHASRKILSSFGS